MEPISPIRTLTKLDRIQPEHLYHAVDTQLSKIRYLHFTGEDLTEKKAYAWYGTKRQFENLCKIHEWDALKLVSPSAL